MGDDLRHHLRQLGKGLQQLNMKLSRISDALDASADAPAANAITSSLARPQAPTQISPTQTLTPALSLLEPLLDLLDAVEQSLDGLDPQSPHAQGLRISRDKTLERLTRAGFSAAPTAGPHDPSLHQVIEVIPSPDAARKGQLCRTFRRGWITYENGLRRIVRPAHVSVYAAQAT